MHPCMSSVRACFVCFWCALTIFSARLRGDSPSKNDIARARALKFACMCTFCFKQKKAFRRACAPTPCPNVSLNLCALLRACLCFYFLESSFCSILHVLPSTCATLRKKFLGALARRLPVQTAIVDFDKDLACLTEKQGKCSKLVFVC